MCMYINGGVFVLLVSRVDVIFGPSIVVVVRLLLYCYCLSIRAYSNLQPFPPSKLATNAMREYTNK